MPKIQRKTQKIFCNSADSDQLAVFGSMSTGTPVYSSDIEELQSNEAFDLGWDAATLEDKAPFMEEMNGVQYGLTYQIAYGLQEGIPEYDAATTYYIGSICKVLEDGKPVLYTSLTDNNIGNDPVNDNINWERLSFGGGGLEIGDIGIAPLGIDETKGKRRYLNGQLIIQDQYVQFTNKVKSAVALYPSLACTESEWQTTATMTVGGQVGKFVVDNDAGTIRLPKIIMPIQGLTDLSKLGEIVEAGLPNITGVVNGMCVRNITKLEGALNLNTYQDLNAAGGSLMTLAEISINAQNSNPIYGNSDTVQQEQIQYPYFIQVATGAETEDNIINEIELNNPFSLLDYKFSEYELNNLSWLRSEGQYNSKIVYPAVYDLLLKIYNGTETKAGVSVKLSTETFTDYDFVLNTTEETFRLPIKVKLASGKAVVGNGMSLGLINGQGEPFSPVTGIRSIGGSNIYGLMSGQVSAYGSQVGAVSYNSGSLIGTNTSTGVTSDPTKSGIETSDSGLYLYFYVGETVQNANLINAGRIEEKLVEKLDRSVVKAYITETYVNGTSGYIVYSNGYCEQWGSRSRDASGNTTITLLKTFSDTNYTITTSYTGGNADTSSMQYNSAMTSSKTTSSFIIGRLVWGWRACGYVA